MVRWHFGGVVLGGVVSDPKSFVVDFFGNFEGGIMNFWEKRDFAPILKFLLHVLVLKIYRKLVLKQYPERKVK